RPEVETQRLVEIFELHVSERTNLDGAGVIDQDVDPAEALQCLLNGGLNLSRLEQVARKGQYVGSEAVELGFGTCKLFGVAGDERHFPTAGANLARNFQPEPARAAGDERNFVVI